MIIIILSSRVSTHPKIKIFIIKVKRLVVVKVTTSLCFDSMTLSAFYCVFYCDSKEKDCKEKQIVKKV